MLSIVLIPPRFMCASESSGVEVLPIPHLIGSRPGSSLAVVKAHPPMACGALSWNSRGCLLKSSHFVGPGEAGLVPPALAAAVSRSIGMHCRACGQVTDRVSRQGEHRRMSELEPS